MPLSRHVDADALYAKSKDHPHKKTHAHQLSRHSGGVYASREGSADIPKYSLPKTGMSNKAAYQMLHDDLELDGTPSLNLASFVHTWMPPEGEKLFVENMYKNLADQDEYPATIRIQERCISIISHFWKVPKGCKAIGTATGGSSEAIMLGGLAMKKRWQEARKAAGKDHYHPNIVFGSNAQVALEKFARYFDVEMRLVPVDASTRFVMSPKRAIEFIDENTIGVMVILGSTYTGAFENVQEMSDLLDEYETKTKHHVPIHVDAASGGFFAPFAYPKYKWAFDVPRVQSINTSGHKFGLTPVGLGWIIWKDEQYLPKDLIFELHYLGSTEYSFNLNFSRPAAPIIAQMYSFLNLGWEGYARIARVDLANARALSRALEASGYYKVVSEIHEKYTDNLASSLAHAVGTADESDPLYYQKGLPVVAFQFSDALKQEYPHCKQEWIQNLLRIKGWIVPNYALPPDAQDQDVLRVVVRESVSAELVESLIADILEITEGLMKKGTSAIMMSTVTEQEPQERAQQTYSKPC
jgi:glutamate decarboxylase